MKRRVMKSQVILPTKMELLIGKEECDSLIRKELSQKIGNEIVKLLESGSPASPVRVETFQFDSLMEAHSLEVTLVDRKDLIKLSSEKRILEGKNSILRQEIEKLKEINVKFKKENDELKDKVKEYEATGIGEVFEAMNKVKVVTEFAEKLEELTNEFNERMEA